MEIKKIRNSNIELMRVCAMFIIIMYHIVIHCVTVQLTDATSIEKMGNGLFNQPVFYKRLLIPSFITPLGIVGNALFIMISGYFMAEKEKINMKKISQKLLLQLGFASIVLVFASTFCYQKMKNIDFDLIRIWDYNDMSWFVGYYFMVMLGAKIFLNKFLAKLDRNQYLTFLISCFAFIQLRWSRMLAENLTSGLSILITGYFLYSLGGYIRKYDPFARVRKLVFIVLILITYLLIFLSSYNTTVNAIQDYLSKESNDMFYQNIQSFSNYSIVIMIISVCVFELFKRLQIPQNKIINYLGATTFMTYLLHDNSFSYSIWNTQDWITLLYYKPILCLIKIAGWALVFLASGVVAYSIYGEVKKIYDKHKYILFMGE
ncbi:acyltransferase family protein [Blautia sp. HCP28S3_G10]|uniref:acyltransferase family protein n=1 Tax=Blautia sp. HCP28S3_G10 TaxID=3438908 RepID=UPI003F8B87D5